jgi:hypothetical protein
VFLRDRADRAVKGNAGDRAARRVAQRRIDGITAGLAVVVPKIELGFAPSEVGADAATSAEVKEGPYAQWLVHPDGTYFPLTS